MSRRAWVVGLVGLVVVLVAGGTFALVRGRDSCGTAVTSVSAAKSSSPFLDAKGRAEQPDRDRDTLVRTLAADPPPIGEVVGAVGYHYEQWAQVSAFDQGIGVRTRDNPDFTMLDDATLKPRWSVQVDTKRSAYDASADRYLVGAMPSKKAPTLVSLDADNGHRRWCHQLTGRPVGPDDPFATQVLGGNAVAVLTPGKGDELRLSRLAGKDGSPVWGKGATADEGDFLGLIDDRRLLVGGRAQYRLLDGSLARRKPSASLVAIDAATGHRVWTRSTPARTGEHVLGTVPGSGTAVLQQQGAGSPSGRLLAIDARGRQRWALTPFPGRPFDATVRAGRVLARAGNRWAAYDAEDGRRLWQRTMPDRPQFLPYGFELESVPLLDDDHVLLGTTTALRTLDLRTGTMTAAALPTDGISTTFWPYQVAVSPGLIAVATNTGAAVVRREGTR